MRISIPREIKNNEYRVAITPAGVHDLVANGHEVHVECGAGDGSSIPDSAYYDAGAVIDPDAATTWGIALTRYIAVPQSAGRVCTSAGSDMSWCSR